MKKQSYITKIRRFLLKREAVNLKGGKCNRCGWSGNIAAFQFHHRDPSEKEFGISKGLTTNWEKYWKEAEKCDLLCANCHMINHSDNSGEQFLKDVDSYKGRALITSDIPWKNKTHIPASRIHICPQCKKEYETSVIQQRYCSFACRDDSKKKCVRPSKEELQKMIETIPMTRIGKQYGVSGNAIKKWCRKYEII